MTMRLVKVRHAFRLGMMIRIKLKIILLQAQRHLKYGDSVRMVAMIPLKQIENGMVPRKFT